MRLPDLHPDADVDANQVLRRAGVISRSAVMALDVGPPCSVNGGEFDKTGIQVVPGHDAHSALSDSPDPPGVGTPVRWRGHTTTHCLLNC